MKNKIIKILNQNPRGLTITDLVKASGISRSSVRTILAWLEGAKRVSFRNIGMAKVYVLSGGKHE